MGAHEFNSQRINLHRQGIFKYQVSLLGSPIVVLEFKFSLTKQQQLSSLAAAYCANWQLSSSNEGPSTVQLFCDRDTYITQGAIAPVGVRVLLTYIVR